MTRPDVAVVGGGLAGIAAALTAAEAGARVTLTEQRPHLGGAASSFRRKGIQIDYGQHVFLRCCSAYRSLIRRVGGEEYLFLQDRLEVPVFAHDSEPAWVRRGPLPPPLHLSRAIASYHHLSRWERVALIRAARALKRLDPQDGSLDDVTFGSWLRQKGQTNRAIEAFWDLIALPTLNLPSAQASLLAAARTFQIGLLTEADAADIGWNTVPLSRLHDELAGEALAAAGVDVYLRTRVNEARMENGGRPRLVLSDGSTLEPGAVILAVEPHALPALLPATHLPLARLFTDMGTSPIVNVHLHFDRSVVPYPVAAGLDSPAHWVFDRTAAVGIDSGQYLIVSISAADGYVRRPADSIVATVIAAFGRIFPRVHQAELLSSQVTKNMAATMQVRPGTAPLRAAGNGSLPGLFLAGAWTDTGWPPTMESAVRSGVGAAQAAMGLRTKGVEV